MSTLCEWCVLRRVHKDLAYTIHYEPEAEDGARARRPRVRIFKQRSHKNNVAIYTLRGKWATSFHDRLDSLLNMPQNIAVEHAHEHEHAHAHVVSRPQPQPQPQPNSEAECGVQHPCPISGA